MFDIASGFSLANYSHDIILSGTCILIVCSECNMFEMKVTVMIINLTGTH